MTHKERTLLIVEDDVDYNDAFKEYCESALDAVSQDLGIQGTIKQAYTYPDAQKILSSGQSVDFVSLDLALVQGEKEASGMRLLRELRAKNSRTIAIIISGESNIDYPLEAIQRLGAMAYFSKSRITDEVYEHTLKAALRYLKTEDQVLALEQQSEPNPIRLEEAKEHWRKVLADIATAGIAQRQLPDDLSPRIDALHQKLLDPHTQLPVGWLLRNTLATRVFNAEKWSMIHVRVENFGIIQISQPSMVKPVLLAITNLLKDVVARYQKFNPFIGFLDQYQTINPSFIIILDEQGSDTAQKIGDKIREEFNRISKTFLSNEEIRNSAKERTKKAMQEGQYQDLAENERKQKEKQFNARFMDEFADLLAPKLATTPYSSEEIEFGNINDLIDEISKSMP